MTLAVDVLRKFAKCKAMAYGNVSTSNIRFQIGINNGALNMISGDRVRTVEHIERQTNPRRLFHRIDHGARVCVKSSPDVLNIVDQRIDILQHFGSKTMLLTRMQAVNREMCSGID